MRRRHRSEHHEITVVDEGGIRTLAFGDTIQSTMRIGAADEGLAYVELFHLPLIFRPAATALFIGLGGATGPKQFLAEYPEMTVDVVEIDPAVIRLARDAFAFEASERAQIHEADGLSFLKSASHQWDVIIVDAYAVEDDRLVIPRELTTRSFFKLVKKHLHDGGFVVFNCAAPHADALTKELEADLAAVFANVAVFSVGDANNSVLLASDTVVESRTDKLVELAKRAKRRGVQRASIVKNVRELKRVKK